MELYLPVYNKMKYSESILISRKLPEDGEIVVKKGAKIVPFTKIGRSKLSKERFKLAPNISLYVSNPDNAFVYKGETIGRVGFRKLIAPYDGYISKVDDTYYFNQEKQDVWTLSGLWGTVEEIVGSKEVKIRTQTIDINFVAYASKFFMGELIVFPNPSELLDLEYLENFSNSIAGKIIYIGHHIRREVYEASERLGVAGLIAGSIESDLYEYSKSRSVAVAITTGFGKYTTPIHIFEFLKTISNRHVFFEGENGYLQVPMPVENNFPRLKSDSSIRKVEPGLSVLLFDKINFGLTGEVESVQNEIVRVKLYKSGDIVDARIPNMFALI